MININVFSEEKAWSKRLRNKDLFFQKICNAFPKKYKFLNKKVSFTLLLSNNKNIQKLNKLFRKKNKPTDILSFPLTKKFRVSKQTYLGDIIISYNFAFGHAWRCGTASTKVGPVRRTGPANLFKSER